MCIPSVNTKSKIGIIHKFLQRYDSQAIIGADPKPRCIMVLGFISGLDLVIIK